MDEQEPTLVSTVFYTVAWFIACALLIMVLINTFSLVKDVLNWIGASIDVTAERMNFENTASAITQGMFFLGGVSAVGLAIGIEYYFRMGEKKGLLTRRVVKMFAVLIALILISVVLRVILPVILF